MLKVESYHSLRRDKQVKSEFDTFLAEMRFISLTNRYVWGLFEGFRECCSGSGERMRIRHILCNYTVGYSEKEATGD